jgi:hypothetical protein
MNSRDREGEIIKTRSFRANRRVLRRASCSRFPLSLTLGTRTANCKLSNRRHCPVFFLFFQLSLSRDVAALISRHESDKFNENRIRICSLTHGAWFFHGGNLGMFLSSMASLTAKFAKAKRRGAPSGVLPA